jgi:putative heme-binding domain-containing protein
MRRGWFLGLFALGAAAVFLTWHPGESAAQARPAPTPQWIWFNEGDPLQSAPAETRYYRRTFTLDPARKVIDKAHLEITADNTFTVWLNGARVGSGDQWQQLYRFDVRKQLHPGKNILAVEAGNQGGPAGLVVRLKWTAKGQPEQTLVSDAAWKTSKNGGKGWNAVDFAEKGWSAVKVLGAYGKVGPWGGAAASGTPPKRRFIVPEGFVVEQAVKRPDDRGPFSLVNMTFDARGRLLLSQEGGPVLLCVKKDKDGVYQEVVDYCTQVRNCQGMCWVGDALLLVGDGPKGTGLYRCRDTKKADKIDEVTLLHKFQGGMGEHGPHAVIHGPDNWIYVVVGNHAHAQVKKLADNSPLTRWPTGGQGPPMGRTDTTEDVLLPRQNDAHGHAANILAPGGTIWRMDHEGKNVSLVAAGFRNHFDAAFSPSGELFTFDSDMEWDEGLPWYRAVRVCHCPPGADFVWRTGAANTPGYYIDSLPSLLETGRGSPVGVEFCDNESFPKKYQGTFFMADWSLGIIYAVHLKRDGATYKGTTEKFCTGTPLNVTDLAFGPDGALYFTMGGRGGQGGVYRISYPKGEKAREEEPYQPLAAWGRARSKELLAWWIAFKGKQWFLDLVAFAVTHPDEKESSAGHLSSGIRLLDFSQQQGLPADLTLLRAAAAQKNPEMRAHAVYLIGVNGYKDGRDTLIKALGDDDALVRRRACEALIRAGIEPPVTALGSVLADKDRFVRTAARLVLQRIDPKKWTDRLWRAEHKGLAREGIIALCKVNKAEPYTEQIFARLHESSPEDVQELLDHLRTIEMALVHTSKRPGSVRGIALECLEQFPHKDWRVNRELAILLTYFRRDKVLDEPVHAKLLSALLKDAEDRQQQIHYFYCLRLLHDGWTAEQKAKLLAWYDGTKSWSGGFSFTPFLENILKDFNPALTAADRLAVVEKADKLPRAAAALLRSAPEKQLPAADILVAAYRRAGKTGPHVKELKEALVTALGKQATPEAQAALRGIADAEPGERDAVARALSRYPTPANFKYILRGLESPSKQVIDEVIAALKGMKDKPKADDPAPFRAVLLASTKLDPLNRWQAVELLRHWTDNKRFGADKPDWQPELEAWSRWFAQSFPKEPPLPNVASDKPSESKYKFEELRAYLLDGPGRKGDPARGRLAFEKGQCLKCHKFGKDGEGIGPDLTTVSKRFKRADILESIYYPSRVISDQYRSVMIVTKKGQQLTGLAAPQGDTVTVLQSDGSKVTLKKSDIDQQYASLVSVMPEKLQDLLTKQELADLFAYLESAPSP